MNHWGLTIDDLEDFPIDNRQSTIINPIGGRRKYASS
jgi:hypothetical protein